VSDTARTAFQVENYIEYVRIQCESAIREVASRHACDNTEEVLAPARYKTLRGDVDRIAEVLLAPAQKVTLVTNLMTVLVGEAHAQPVLQIGAAEACLPLPSQNARGAQCGRPLSYSSRAGRITSAICTACSRSALSVHTGSFPDTAECDCHTP